MFWKNLKSNIYVCVRVYIFYIKVEYVIIRSLRDELMISSKIFLFRYKC